MTLIEKLLKCVKTSTSFKKIFLSIHYYNETESLFKHFNLINQTYFQKSFIMVCNRCHKTKLVFILNKVLYFRCIKVIAVEF